MSKQKMIVEIEIDAKYPFFVYDVSSALRSMFPSSKFKVVDAAQLTQHADSATPGVCPHCKDKLFCAMCGNHVE